MRDGTKSHSVGATSGQAETAGSPASDLLAATSRTQPIFAPKSSIETGGEKKTTMICLMHALCNLHQWHVWYGYAYGWL